MTASHFVRVADTVAVSVVQHHSVALTNLASVVGEDTRIVRVGGRIVVVAGHVVLAAHNFQLVAHAVTIHVAQTNAVAVVVVRRVFTHSVVLHCNRAVVARLSVGAANEVTHTIAIQIQDAIAVAVERVVRVVRGILAAAVVERRCGVVVARAETSACIQRSVGATVAREEVAGSVVEGGVGIVVASHVVGAAGAGEELT